MNFPRLRILRGALKRRNWRAVRVITKHVIRGLWPICKRCGKWKRGLRPLCCKCQRDAFREWLFAAGEG